MCCIQSHGHAGMFPILPRPLKCWAAESRLFTPLFTVVSPVQVRRKRTITKTTQVSFLETFLLTLPTSLPTRSLPSLLLSAISTPSFFKPPSLTAPLPVPSRRLISVVSPFSVPLPRTTAVSLLFLLLLTTRPLSLNSGPRGRSLPRLGEVLPSRLLRTPRATTRLSATTSGVSTLRPALRTT